MRIGVTDENARFVGGLALTGSLLAAGHWFKWWIPLGRIGAYTYGVVSILLGQGLFLGFNGLWRKMCAFALVAGTVVDGAYRYDRWANDRAKRLASGERDNAQRAPGTA